MTQERSLLSIYSCLKSGGGFLGYICFCLRLFRSSIVRDRMVSVAASGKRYSSICWVGFVCIGPDSRPWKIVPIPVVWHTEQLFRKALVPCGNANFSPSLV